MKKMLVMCLLATSLVGCSASTQNTEVVTEEVVSENTDIDTEDNSFELSETESLENFETYMRENDITESKKIKLPPYHLEDFALFQVKEGKNDSDKMVVHMKRDGYTTEEKERIQSYIDSMNDFVSNGKKVKSSKLNTDDANYHLYISFEQLYSDTTLTYYNTQSALDVYLYDNAMLIVNEAQEKEWCYKK